jgi:hypothetical protein
MSVRKLAATILATLGMAGVAFGVAHAEHAQTHRAQAATMVEYALTHHVSAATAIEYGLTLRR